MNRVRYALRLLCAAAVIVIISLFCWQCMDIYLSGPRASTAPDAGIYSMPDARQRFIRHSPLLIICLSIICIASIFNAGCNFSHTTQYGMHEHLLRSYNLRTAQLPAAAAREVVFRKRVQIVCGALCTFCAVGCLAYLLNPVNFASWDLERVIGAMLSAVTPWLAVGLAALMTAMHLCQKSLAKEVQLLKTVPHAAGSSSKDSQKGRHGIVQMLLYVLAVLLIILGIMNGGLYDVFVKAINICTECIGLG